MSHNLTVSNIKINDIDALELAVNELRGEGIPISLEKDAMYRGFNASQSRKMPYVIKLPEKGTDGTWSDVGLELDKEGNYVPVFDPMNNLAKHVGYQRSELDGTACDISSPAAYIGKLFQHYAACKIEREAAMQGKTVTRQGIDPKTKAFNLVVSGY